MRTLAPALILASALLTGCRSGGEDTAKEETVAVAEAPGTRGPDADREIFERTVSAARAAGLDSLPTGEVMARIGAGFVGTTYTPNTLDAPGPERLVVNLRELDCVTFVENMMAMAIVIRSGGGFDEYLKELERIRYREGRVAGYPSRLHYFSEWISSNDAKGLVRNVTQELGGERDPEPLTFMTSHAEAYRHLSDPENLQAIRAMEERLSREPRYFIPEPEIDRIAGELRNGDVIAATSTLPGLDVAHTGLVYIQNGKPHLLHAPLVGSAVEISRDPIAERLRKLDKQDGIMVARPR